MDFAGFSKIEVGSVFQAKIVKSERYRVTIQLDDNALLYLRVDQTGDRLIVDLDGVDLTRNLTLKAEIAMPDLEGVSIRGVSSAEVTGFDFDHAIEFDVSGVSQLSGTLNAGDVTITLSGPSSISLSGSGKNLTVKVSNPGHFDLSNFRYVTRKIERRR